MTQTDAERQRERELLERARSNDREARGELIERHQDAVFRLAWRLTHGRQHEAEDLAQEALLRALKGLASFRGDAGFGTWLHRIVVNFYRNQRGTLSAKAQQTTLSLNDRGPEEGEGSTLLEVAEPGQGPAEQATRSEETEQLMRAVNELEEDRREVMWLHLEGHSYEEMAYVLQVPVGTVRSRLSRARQDLRQQLAESASTTRPT